MTLAISPGKFRKKPDVLKSVNKDLHSRVPPVFADSYFFAMNHSYPYPSIAARGGGGSFKRLKLYNSEEHLPIESFVTTLIH